MMSRRARSFEAWIFGLLLVCAVTALGTGCAGKAVDENDPASLYKEAEEEIESDHYQLAIDKLRAVKNRFPYSKYATDAQLRIADVYFMQELFSEAALSYESFRDLHPKHEKVGYAMFRIGKAYFSDIPGNLARDLTPAYRAQDAFHDFLLRFPSAPEADEARKLANDIRKVLADKELYIGNFYWRNEKYDSAKSRYEKVSSLYPETPAATAAKDRLKEIADKNLISKGAKVHGRPSADAH